MMLWLCSVCDFRCTQVLAAIVSVEVTCRHGKGDFIQIPEACCSSLGVGNHDKMAVATWELQAAFQGVFPGGEDKPVVAC